MAGVSARPPLFKISIAEWSLHNRLFKRQQPHLDNLDFAKTAKSLGISGIEYVNQFFMDKAKDAAYLKELTKRADGEGVKQLLIMCDREGNLGDANDAKRTQAVQNHHKWADAAKTLGCHSIRVNARSSGSWDEQVKLAADGLHRLTEYTAKLGLNCLVENHGGLSSNGKWLAKVMKTVDHPRCGTLPDFGNFRVSKTEVYDRYLGVKELMPYAKAVSAKSGAFDAKGNETQTDYRRMMKIVLDAGYRGWVGVEYSGKIPEADGIIATRKLLETIRKEMSS